MDKNFIKSKLINYELDKVLVFLSYLNKLETETRDNKLKNPWIKYVKDQQFIDKFVKVAIDKLYIDGETITFQYYSGILTVSYQYQAYRKLLLMKHPDSKLDMSVVYKGDVYSFRKDTGKIIYSHVISDPFAKDKEIIGCYCITKNSLGENLETLNMEVIAKMRNTAKTDVVWKYWFSEMVLKSVLKRACKRYFYDTFKNVESSDNENYDLEKVNYDAEVQKLVSDAKTVADLTKIYKKEISLIEDKNTFISNVSKRKKEIIISEFKSGTDIKVLKANYKLDDKYCEEIKNG